MRIKRNSSEADLSVMRDKALDLGYTWNVIKYPTPAWEIGSILLDYDKPLFDIPVDVWNRELRFWGCDCAEGVLPIWEDWSRKNLSWALTIPRASILAARQHAQGKLSTKKLRAYKNVDITGGDFLRDISFYAATNAYEAAYFLIFPFPPIDVYGPSQCAIMANYYNVLSQGRSRALAEAKSGEIKTKLTQDLINRIDAVAPWRLQ